MSEKAMTTMVEHASKTEAKSRNRSAWFEFWSNLPVNDEPSRIVLSELGKRFCEACESEGRAAVVHDVHGASPTEAARTLVDAARDLASNDMALVVVPGALTDSPEAQEMWADLAQRNVVAAAMEMPATPVGGWRARTLPYVAFVLDAARKPEASVAIMRFDREFLLSENAEAARNVVRVAMNAPRLQSLDEERVARMVDEASGLLADLLLNPRAIAGVSCLVSPADIAWGGQASDSADAGAAEPTNAQAGDARAPSMHASYRFDDYAHDVRFGMDGATLYEAGEVRHEQWKAQQKILCEQWDAELAAEEEAALEG